MNLKTRGAQMWDLYWDFGGSYFHPELPVGFPEASFLLSHLRI